MTKIVIDPGHGGSDNGASGNGIIEKNLTLDISKYMYDQFDKLGIPVSITRTTDETLTPTERVERILAPYGNSSDVIIISNHINAGGGDGAEVIYALRNNGTLANKVLEEIRLAGQNVRKAYQRRLPSDTSKDYYFIHRNTGITEPIIVEYGFLDSTSDDVSQLKNNWRDYVDAVVRGVADYIGVAYDQDVEGIYVVKSGDTLYSIARKYNTTVDEIKRLNDLTSNTLTIGTKLIVPTEKEDESKGTYVVKAGDTLYKIANANNVTVADIINANKLTSNVLSIGQELIIPSKNQNVPDSNYINHTVIKGDNLYSIARKYNTTVQELMNINNLKSNLLSIGQVIKVPKTTSDSNTPNNVYTVKSGDTLYSIARKFGKTVSDIQKNNNLSTTTLSIGQELII